MKALSIRQPWAWLIVNGHKDIENRNWKTNYRGPVLIHTGSFSPLDDYFESVRLARSIVPDIHVPTNNRLERGGYVGVAEIVDCVEDSDSPWFFGRFGFVLKNARTIPFRKARGQLGLYEVEERVDA